MSSLSHIITKILKTKFINIGKKIIVLSLKKVKTKNIFL